MSEKLFISGCIPARFFLVYLTYKSNKYPKLQNFLGFIYLLISLGFFYLFITNQRLNAPEGGGDTWWSNIRIVHSIFYFIASLMCFANNPNAYLLLLSDLIFGIGAFVNHRYFKI